MTLVPPWGINAGPLPSLCALSPHRVLLAGAKHECVCQAMLAMGGQVLRKAAEIHRCLSLFAFMLHGP